ncbi:hypothetical protein [Massilia aerilata]|uniref:Uncharacterized protein n=1 Tax=Massilia aerilata TaxID=453817 RepID=A0ABW0S2D8_9BURK
MRNRPEGEMGDFLKQPRLPNEDYIVERIGHVGRSIIARGRSQAEGSAAAQPTPMMAKLKKLTPRKLVSHLRVKLRDKLGSEALRIGAFRLSGEIHMGMYDRYSLGRLLEQAGFTNVRRDVAPLFPDTA